MILTVVGNFPDIASFLVGIGADPNAKNANGSTPLHLAATSGSHEICYMLAGNGQGIIWTEDNEGICYFHYSVRL
jgi:ankyrin repeat protein